MASYEAWFKRAHGEKFPILCILKEKHGTYHYLCRTIEDVPSLAVATVARRLEEGWYECDEHPEKTVAKAQSIVEKNTGWVALSFLMGRFEYEYEGIEFMEFDTWEEL